MKVVQKLTFCRAYLELNKVLHWDDIEQKKGDLDRLACIFVSVQKG
jgi:hypothetical protein